MKITPELYRRWRRLAERLWEETEQAEGMRERLRREIPAEAAQEIMNALAQAYHKNLDVWELIEWHRNYAIQAYKHSPHRWERRKSAALFRLLRMQLRRE